MKRCYVCRRMPAECKCVDMCSRCNLPSAQCSCEESIRPGLHDHDDDRFQEDEEYQYNLEHDYGDDEEKTNFYWHGYNTVKRIGKKGKIQCPYMERDNINDFYRGVSDWRFYN